MFSHESSMVETLLAVHVILTVDLNIFQDYCLLSAIQLLQAGQGQGLGHC